MCRCAGYNIICQQCHVTEFRLTAYLSPPCGHCPQSTPPFGPTVAHPRACPALETDLGTPSPRPDCAWCRPAAEAAARLGPGAVDAYARRAAARERALFDLHRDAETCRILRGLDADDPAHRRHWQDYWGRCVWRHEYGAARLRLATLIKAHEAHKAENDDAAARTEAARLAWADAGARIERQARAFAVDEAQAALVLASPAYVEMRARELDPLEEAWQWRRAQQENAVAAVEVAARGVEWQYRLVASLRRKIKGPGEAAVKVEGDVQIKVEEDAEEATPEEEEEEYPEEAQERASYALELLKREQARYTGDYDGFKAGEQAVLQQEIAETEKFNDCSLM